VQLRADRGVFIFVVNCCGDLSGDRVSVIPLSAYAKSTYPPEKRAQLLKQFKEVNCALIDTFGGVHVCQCALHKREHLGLEFRRHMNFCPWDMVLLADIETSKCGHSLYHELRSVNKPESTTMQDLPLLGSSQHIYHGACCFANAQLHQLDLQAL
jgi:hypothetical protein